MQKKHDSMQYMTSDDCDKRYTKQNKTTQHNTTQHNTNPNKVELFSPWQQYLCRVQPKVFEQIDMGLPQDALQ